mmetsp:Transcript_99431/g.306570  ORF Transcript_99431/g.306570 Transcript_99431/m.306570 type:complete len:444 (-) Transcript_99431:276-1607(-)
MSAPEPAPVCPACTPPAQDAPGQGLRGQFRVAALARAVVGASSAAPQERAPLAAPAATGGAGGTPVRAMAFSELGAEDETPPEFREITYELPPPAGTEVHLRVDATGVCHSDLLICAPPPINRKMGAKRPDTPKVLGHEIAGTVIAMGPDVRGLRIGDRRVAFPWIGGCGSRCWNCRAGVENLCQGGSMKPPCPDARLGISGRPGGYASAISVDARYLVDHGSIPPELACTMCCSGITAYTAVKKVLRGNGYGPLPEGAAVLVVGAGGVGLNGVGLLKDMGPAGTKVIVMDSDPQKRDAATRAGADAFVDGKAPTANREIRSLTEDGLGVHAAIDFVGLPQTMKLCMGVLQRGGKIVQVGLYNGIMDFPTAVLPEYGATMEGSMTGTLADFKEMMALAREGKILTSRQIPVQTRHISQVQQTLLDLHGKRYVGRVVLTHAAPA